ncbi:MAG: type II toxin-antitoxin system VapC family toxin [Crenarchaeota archaeon]|nr:type II toxin-antitoxin system VapC family toxin [Thermoproteota archaeon]
MGERYYLDTSAIVKRYVEEYGSRTVDDLFNKAHKGSVTIVFSYWNVGEAAVVFDKYGEKLGLESTGVFRMMLRELRMLLRTRSAILVNVTPKIIRESVKLVFNHHLYVADAVQIVSAKQMDARMFVTGDARLAEASMAEGLETLCLA